MTTIVHEIKGWGVVGVIPLSPAPLWCDFPVAAAVAGGRRPRRRGVVDRTRASVNGCEPGRSGRFTPG